MKKKSKKRARRPSERKHRLQGKAMPTSDLRNGGGRITFIGAEREDDVALDGALGDGIAEDMRKTFSTWLRPLERPAPWLVDGGIAKEHAVIPFHVVKSRGHVERNKSCDWGLGHRKRQRRRFASGSDDEGTGYCTLQMTVYHCHSASRLQKSRHMA